MLNAIIKTSGKVEELLTNNPALRDDDNKLVAKIWWQESNASTFKDFLIEFGAGKVTTPGAITRARRKLQEHNPDLRGNLYAKRHKNEKEVRSHIKFVNF
jgi:hypothetical protein|tara:strand:+ start:796 stop:1095 length:300 start_codon:yes stop_codon:yes gene_type:complete